MQDDLDKIQQHPLYRKGKEIVAVATKISDLIPEEEEMLQDVKRTILEHAFTLVTKVAAAEAAELYDLKMEQAAIIRRAARELMVQNHSLTMFGFKEVSYYSIVRDLIEEYRLLFIDWVAGFDTEHYVIDRWGLFNPPGIGSFDKDPDDDIPFNPDDYL